jgi:endo-1,4-beta-xylanase
VRPAGGPRHPAEGLATLYDENYQPKKAYQIMRADLAFSGPPLVLPRIPQKPRR